MFAFAKFAKNNALISSLYLFIQDRKNFNQQILDARQLFLNLMNVAQNSKLMSKKRKIINKNVKIFFHFKQNSIFITSINSFFDDFVIENQIF